MKERARVAAIILWKGENGKAGVWDVTVFHSRLAAQVWAAEETLYLERDCERTSLKYFWEVYPLERVV